MTENTERDKNTDTASSVDVQPVVMRLNELEAEKGVIYDNLQSVNDDIERKALELMELQHGVSVGCTVVLNDGRRAMVTFIETSRWNYKHNKPWLKGRIKNKDGEFSKREQHLYTDWELAS